MKKTLSIVLSLMMMLTTLTALPFTAQAGDSGTTGDCTWEFSGKTLTISGNGAMEDYEIDSDGLSTAPWTSYLGTVEDISIRKGVTAIGDYAFVGAKIQSIFTPSSTERIGEYAFSYCRNLKYIYTYGNQCVIEANAFYECEGTQPISELVTDGVKTIEESAFYECDIKRIIFRDGLEYIGYGAFALNEAIQDVRLPFSCTFIDDCAFSGSTLKSIAIPNLDCHVVLEKETLAVGTLQSIIAFPGSKAQAYAKEFGVEFIDLASGMLPEGGNNDYYDFDLATGTLFIVGIGVVEGNWPDNNPYDCFAPLIRKVVFGDGIIRLTRRLFKGDYSNLQEITMEDSVQVIEEKVFAMLPALTSVTLSKNIERIGNNAFADCPALKSVTVPNTVNIGYHALGFLMNDEIWSVTPGFTLKTPCSAQMTKVDLYVGEYNLLEGLQIPLEKIHTPAAAVKENEIAATYTAAGSYDSVVKCAVCGAEISRQSVSVPMLTTQPVVTTPAKQTVKLSLKKVAVKKSAKKLVLQATLKIDGKAVKGKKVTFKFNGKKYTAKTNNKGVAKVTVKKSVLKKLKKGKKVTYSATYGKKTVKKTVKVK